MHGGTAPAVQPQLLAATTTAVAAHCDLTFRWIEEPNASLYRRLYCGLKGEIPGR